MDNNNTIHTRSLESLVTDFCKIVLTENDCFDYDKAKLYISSLQLKEIELLENAFSQDKKQIHFLVRTATLLYIQKYRDNKSTIALAQGSLFAFDSGNNYSNFVRYFGDTYKEVHPNSTYPKAFGYIFDYIGDLSEHNRLFEQFYEIRTKEMSENILSEMTTYAESIIQSIVTAKVNPIAQAVAKKSVMEAAGKAAQKAAAKARDKAEIAAKASAEAAENASKAATDAVEVAVDKKMNYVTSKISETSVTILGMFSGIVLTAVAGLFYSASVLENINAANFWKLLCASSLVGFVCINLMATMFRFIDKFRSGEKCKTENSEVPKAENIIRIIKNKIKILRGFSDLSFVNLLLVVLILTTGIIQIFQANTPQSPDINLTDVNISAQVNIPSNDGVKDSTADTTTGGNVTADSDSISNQGTQSDGTDTSTDIASGDSTGADTSTVPIADSSTTT